MGNPWFRFKQFTIIQEGAALKVGTDACLLGAWAHHPAPARMLDIGTGTGLLALMLAQRYAVPMHALEPEPAAAAQAQKNFSNSPWPQQIRLFAQPVQTYFPPQLYDLIVCNPPFYQNHLKTANVQRNMALHQETLSFAELAEACKRLLASNGLCYILLPPRQALELEKECIKCDLYVQQKLCIQERANSAVHRMITTYGHQAFTGVKEATLIIRNAEGDYSEAYQSLLKDYYLIF